jgi:eukaryotic-like serine/threonine-protein kinase
MREVSRALALDPLNEKATGLLMQLFTEPPRELPGDAAREMNQAGRADQQRSARIAAMLYLTWFLYLPLALYQGIRDARLYVLISLAFLAAALAFARVARSRKASGEEYASVVAAMLAASSLAATAGPFVIVPTIVLANMAGFLLQVGRARRWLVIVLGCFAVVGPLALEWAGFVPPSYAFHDDRLEMLPRLLDLPKGVSLGVLSGVHVMLIVTASVFFARFRGSLRRAEEAVHINAWQLRQLVPREARAAVTDQSG